MAGEPTDRDVRTRPSAVLRDLAPRAVSGAALAVVAVGATWWGAVPFALLVGAVALIMSWEWSRIVRGAANDRVFLVHVIAVAVAVVLTARGMPAQALAACVAGAIGVQLLARTPHLALSSLGVLYAGLPAIALIWLRGYNSLGALAILFVFATVWTTDTFAYLCGRLIGGPKLWPAMSPGKTWSGTAGGIVFAGLAGALFSVFLLQQPPLVPAVVAVVLSIVSQAGDLAESGLKRAFSIKNASELIPGHGGFMDRMDGAVTAAIVAAVIAVVRDPAFPAQSLLLWS